MYMFWHVSCSSRRTTAWPHDTWQGRRKSRFTSKKYWKIYLPLRNEVYFCEISFMCLINKFSDFVFKVTCRASRDRCGIFNLKTCETLLDLGKVRTETKSYRCNWNNVNSRHPRKNVFAGSNGILNVTPLFLVSAKKLPRRICNSDIPAISVGEFRSRSSFTI